MRLLAAGVAMLVGFVASIASIGLHEKSWAWWSLALAAPLSAVLALPRGLVRVGFVGGFLVPLALAVQVRPEGDYLVASTPRGYGLLAAGLVLLTLGVATIPRPARQDRAPRTPYSDST